ncbi:CG0192-related protein [Nocardioides sp. Bht2]|uniref:CG0192-related protein n=1 Tax=Nocardioides sp. Bht2 TaxID=3392297 RepID=UPI0039B495D7
MAVLHRAQISPTKLELVTAWLDQQPWGGSGEVELIGGYRFDDPDGEVGIESLLARRGDLIAQLPVTYRGAPLDGAEEYLITTMEHSALGKRWIYAATGDPVAMACFARALTGEQQQAEVEVHHADGRVEQIEPPVRVRLEGTTTSTEVRFSTDLATPVTGAARLVASWAGGEDAVVAAAG